MTHDERMWYMDLIDATKMDAAARMRLFMCITVIEAVENGFRDRESLHAELRKHGVKVEQP